MHLSELAVFVVGSNVGDSIGKLVGVDVESKVGRIVGVGLKLDDHGHVDCGLVLLYFL